MDDYKDQFIAAQIEAEEEFGRKLTTTEAEQLLEGIRDYYLSYAVDLRDYYKEEPDNE